MKRQMAIRLRLGGFAPGFSKRRLSPLSTGLVAAAVALVPALAWAAPVPASSRAESAAVVSAPGGLLAPSPGSATIHLARAEREEDAVRTLQLELGKSALMKTEFRVRRVSVGDPEILDVVVLSPTELQLVPKQAGGTNVVLWDPAGAPQAAIDVEVGATHSHIERLLRKLLRNDDIHVESAGDSIVLRGTVPSPASAERAIAVARAFFPDRPETKVINLLEVGGNQQVMIEVIVSEMSRTLSHKLAVNWETIIETGANAFTFQSLLSSMVSLEDDLWPKTNFLVSDRVNLVGQFVNPDDFSATAFAEFANLEGLAKILAQPTLVARSGQKASFLVGGEVPIPVAQGGAFGSITIEFKDFGVGMNFAPTVLGPDRIYLEVSPEVSDIDFTLGSRIGDIVTPGFRTRRASTTVELADGQSFAIAGLLRDDVLESVESYPVLGDIPILGALFRSSKFQKNETELVIIVTTSLVKPLPLGPHPLPTDSFLEPSESEFYLLGALESGFGTGHDIEEPEEKEETGGELIGPAGHRVPIDIEKERQ